MNTPERSGTDRKRILFVESNQDGTVGGSYFSLLYLLRVLDRTRYDPVVMFYNDNELIDTYFKELCPVVIFRKPLGIPLKAPFRFLHVPYAISRKGYNYFRVLFFPFIRFLIFTVKNRIDMVHLNDSVFGGIEWLIICKLLQRRCIAHHRGIVPFTRWARFRSRFFDSVICISGAVQQRLGSRGIDNTKIIYNAIDVGEFRARVSKKPRSVREEFHVPASAPFIGLVGNFQEWKGQIIVVNAMKIVIRKHPNAVCLFIGNVSSVHRKDIAYYNAVRKAIDDGKLKENIILTGYRSDIPDIINALDIMIHASIDPEPFGRVLLEGMCLEKPVIATDMGGPTEIIEDGISGILIPPGDPEILAERIDGLLQNPDHGRELGMNALKQVEKKFGLQRFSVEINSLYTDLFHQS
jgi:glycosyltransferase involved in cell wall biosynthesis